MITLSPETEILIGSIFDFVFHAFIILWISSLMIKVGKLERKLSEKDES